LSGRARSGVLTNPKVRIFPMQFRMQRGWMPRSTAGKHSTHFSDTRVVWL
jgi:hypothetical protein